jgi:hypothetical protein
MRLESWVLDGVLCVFFLLILRESSLVIGKEKSRIFLWGSLLWTGIIENLMVIMGGYDYFAYANYYTFNGKLINGYPGWFSWVLFVPLCICLGWFLLSFPALLISIRLLGKNANIWLKAALSGIFLVSFDMLMDPISVVNEWWRWTSPGYYIRGVNFGNYIGWFFLIFFFGAVFERTVIQLKGFQWLLRIEKWVFKINTKNLSDTPLKTIGRIFYFRLLVCLPVFYLALTLTSSLVTAFFGNNFGPFESVFPQTLSAN